MSHPPRAAAEVRPNAGVGHAITRMCAGCNKAKNAIGSTGLGLRWRCAACSLARAQSRAEATPSAS